jgi:hypothetical protein
VVGTAVDWATVEAVESGAIVDAVDAVESVLTTSVVTTGALVTGTECGITPIYLHQAQNRVECE